MRTSGSLLVAATVAGCLGLGGDDEDGPNGTDEDGVNGDGDEPNGGEDDEPNGGENGEPNGDDTREALPDDPVEAFAQELQDTRGIEVVRTHELHELKEIQYRSDHLPQTDGYREELEAIAGLFAEYVDEGRFAEGGWAAERLDVIVSDANEEYSEWYVDADAAREWLEGDLSNTEFVDGILETLSISYRGTLWAHVEADLPVEVHSFTRQDSDGSVPAHESEDAVAVLAYDSENRIDSEGAAEEFTYIALVCADLVEEGWDVEAVLVMVADGDVDGDDYNYQWGVETGHTRDYLDGAISEDEYVGRVTNTIDEL